MKACKIIFSILNFLMLILVSENVLAQESEGGTPPSFLIKNTLSKVELPKHTTGKIPLSSLIAEDEIYDKGKFPFRFGYGFDVSIDIKKDGYRQVLTDGNLLWRYSIQCPNAISVNVLFSAFKVPEGGKMFLYGEDKTQVLGAFTSRNVTKSGQFATALIIGNSLTIEYTEPSNVVSPGIIVIGKIVHGYRDHSSFKQDVQSASGSCEINVNCPQGAGWENQKRAVARIIIDGTYYCTGTLINNTANDDKPYFLTANHCTNSKDAVNNSDASGWVFYWNYESTSCSGSVGQLTQTTSGAVLKANSEQSDFALLQLNNKPPASYNVFYSGWNRSNSPSAGAVCIHHPAGDIKKFSKDNSTLIHDGNYWKVPSWDLGVTEGGSSGSGLFDLNKRLVGQLLGGASACGGSDLSDSYGKIWYSWDQAGTIPQRRLKDWLDPINSGVIVLDGKNPGLSTNKVPVVTINSPVNGALLAAPASINILVSASDQDGSISKVIFYSGNTIIGEDVTYPYSFNWTNITSGSYIITARAIDNAGMQGISAPVNLVVANLRIPENPTSTVNGINFAYYEGSWNNLPTYSSLTPIKIGTSSNFEISPRNREDQFGFKFTGFINIIQDGVYTFYTESDDGSRLYIGTTLVVENDGLHGPTERSGVIGLKAGKHAISVEFFENGGGQLLNVSYSSSTLIKQLVSSSNLFREGANISPNVSISTPINNSSFNAPATITITANASDPDGSIAKVEFFAGTTKIGEDLTSPYSIVWSGVSAGNYSISAKATDNLLLTATSASISISVGSAMVQTPYGGKAALIPGKIEAENFDLGGQGIAYRDVENANRGNGVYRNEGVDIEKCLDAGGGFNVGYIRVGEWIEYTVQVQATRLYKVDLRVASLLTGKTIRLEMNGVSMGGNILIPNTGGWQSYQTVTLNNVSLNQGIQIMRIVAVSDDVNINHIAFSSLQVNKLPAVSITSPIHNSTINSPSNITINANAMDLDGSIVKLEFFQGITKLGEDLAAPYSFLWSNVQAGNYELSVKAYDNSGGVGTSAPVFITLRVSDVCSMLPQYTEGSNYVAGTKVTNNGSQFECREWPYSSWCNGASWAYEPGTGAFWTDAWYDRGACLSKNGELLFSISVNEINLMPNPAISYFKIQTQNDELIEELEIIDSFGKVVLRQLELASGSNINVEKYQSGVFMVRIKCSSRTYLKKLIKQ